METPMRYINNVKDLDLEIKRVDEKFNISDDEGRRALSEFSYVVDGTLPPDPFQRILRCSNQAIPRYIR